MSSFLRSLPLILLGLVLGYAKIVPSETSPSRVEVLFLGAPKANHPSHDPIERYRILKKALGKDGINLSYTEDLRDLRDEVLSNYDGVLLYGNWLQNQPVDPGQEKALLHYVENGGAFLPIHSASACFGGSDAFVKLVGGRFKSHGAGEFATTITDPNHPIMRGYEGFTTWDETYVHDRHGDDRTILQKLGDEPWTWVREQGKGKVFYTAYGHDMRCWSQPAFHELLRRAILWSVSPQAMENLPGLRLPQLETEEMILPGYRERKTITRGQKPLPPLESMKLAQVPAGHELSLFASEPDIVNPIHITWDDRGRAFVIETIDYPNNLQAGNIGNDRIKLCEDTDGDGKADRFTVFADKLSIPTSSVFVNGGLICTNGTDMIFLKDTDGDNVADLRKTLFTGFKMHDTHAGVSNLRYGFDHWIYATIGYSGFEGVVGGETHRFTNGLFRFRADGSKLEYLQGTTNNTWGLGFTADFDILGSTANANPSWYHTFPKFLHDGAKLPQSKTPAADGNPVFFPSSTDIRQVDQHDRYTSAAGHAFYTAARFSDQMHDGIAMICEPTGKLVGRFEVTREGAGFKSRQLPNNLYSSADAWSGPVHAETGPDGAVWIADWYNIIIQHNPTPSKASAGYDAVKGRGNAYETPLRDQSMGRIYRVFPKGSANDAYPALGTADELIRALSHPNLFWRLQAQRLLIERNPGGVSEKLSALVSSDPGGRASVHAFQALAGLGSPSSELIRLSLTNGSRALRRAALSHLGQTSDLITALLKDNEVTANDDRELAERFAAMATLPASESLGRMLHSTLTSRAAGILRDRTLRDAWQMAARRHAAGVLAAAPENQSPAIQPVNLLPDPGFESGQPGIWNLKHYGGGSPQKVSLTIDAGRNGGRAIRISSPAPADAGAGAVVKVKPDTRYRFGGWIRTETFTNAGGKGVMFNAHGRQSSRGLSGTTDWQEIHFEFDSGDAGEVLIHCLFGGYGTGTGTAWFDDLYLHEIESGGTEAVLAEVRNHVKSLNETVETTVRKHTPDPQVHDRGREIYNRTCVACHGPDGKGVPNTFPPLDGAEWVVGDPSIPARIVIAGLQGPIVVKGEKFNNIMPPHSDLTDADVSDVLTFIRQSWENDAPPVSPATIREIRARFKDRTTPWTAEDLKSK